MKVNSFITANTNWVDGALSMGYLTVWKVLEEMITDFRRRGVAVPKEVIGDLKYARTLINVLKADPSSLETSQRIEEYLNNIESYL
ncbi:MAG: DUF2096 family protein, partial [Candidatus Bathyarchaeia archaeon]